MNPREFVYIGKPVPKIDKTVHKEFLQNFQKAMLLSLEERKLLTKKQTDLALDALMLVEKRK